MIWKSNILNRKIFLRYRQQFTIPQQRLPIIRSRTAIRLKPYGNRARLANLIRMKRAEFYQKHWRNTLLNALVKSRHWLPNIKVKQKKRWHRCLILCRRCRLMPPECMECRRNRCWIFASGCMKRTKRLPIHVRIVVICRKSILWIVRKFLWRFLIIVSNINPLSQDLIRHKKIVAGMTNRWKRTTLLFRPLNRICV